MTHTEVLEQLVEAQEALCGVASLSHTSRLIEAGHILKEIPDDNEEA